MALEFTHKNPARSVPGKRDWPRSLLRGLSGKCPQCGRGRIFRKYLKIAESCNDCGEELHHHQADDAPPYFTIFIVGHIIVPAVFIMEKLLQPEIWVHMLVWLPLTLFLTLLLLPRIKGGIVGLQWALRMHGFEYSALCSPERREH